MKIFLSNQPEALLQKLITNLAKTNSSFTQKKYFLIQSQAMAHYLKTQLAKKLKIAFNFHFFFPISLLEYLQEKIIFTLYQTTHHFSTPNRYRANHLFFLIVHLLKNLSAPELLIFKNYIGSSLRKRYELALELAKLFDHYFFYQKDLFDIYQDYFHQKKGRFLEYFQAQKVLYQEVLKEYPYDFPFTTSEKIIDFFANEKKTDFLKNAMPEVINVFGVSFLPPYYIEFLKKLARHFTIHFYFFDISNASSIPTSKQSSFHFIKNLSSQNYNFYHSLRGNSSKEHLPPLQEQTERTSFFDQQAINLLALIQKHFYPLVNQEKIKPTIRAKLTEYSSPFFSPTKTYPNLMIQACSSLLNEVENLKDMILNILKANDYEINLSDFLVVAPNINHYQHYITSVFNQEPILKYSLSDLTNSKENQIYSRIEKLLNHLENDILVNDFLAILEIEEIREKFTFSLEEIQQIKMWLSESEIRWLDSPNKTNPKENSWEKGIKKIVYSYFMTGEPTNLNINLLAEETKIEKELLSKFLFFFREIEKIQKTITQEKPLSKWLDFLLEIINNFFISSQSKQNNEIFLKIITTIQEEASIVQEEEPINFTVSKLIFSTYCKNTFLTGGFLSGGITFASLLPMRAIPFKYIFILGLEEENFPRQETLVDYNLLLALPEEAQKGFRSKEKDDQLILLENIICAKKFLGLSFVSNGLKLLEDTNLSSLVVNIIKQLASDLKIPPADLYAKITCFHKAQKYQTSYFSKENYFQSFDKSYFESFSNNYINDKNQTSLEKNHSSFYPYFEKITTITNNFIEELLEKNHYQKNRIYDFPLSNLFAYYQNPLKYYFKNIIKMDLTISSNSLANPSLTLNEDKLKEKIMISNALKKVLNQKNFFDYPTIKKKDILPIGNMGEVDVLSLNQFLQKNTQEITAFFYQKKIRLTEDLKAKENQEYFFTQKIINTEFNFTFLIDDFFDKKNSARITSSFKLKNSDFMKLYLEHLLLHLTGEKITSYIFDLNDSKIFSLAPYSRKKAQDHFHIMLFFYWQKDEFPLPFLQKLTSLFTKGEERTEAELKNQFFKTIKSLAEESDEKNYPLEEYQELFLFDEYFLKGKLPGISSKKIDNLWSVYQFFFKFFRENFKLEKNN